MASTIPNVAGLDSDQVKNAKTIIAVGKAKGATPRDIEIALMTSLTESSLVNLHSGDRDSEGLFQQRPSAGWGTPAQVTNAVYASNKFYSSLLAKPATLRNGSTPWLAAQAVQISAYSNGSNYQANWAKAQQIYSNLEGGTVATDANTLKTAGTSTTANSANQGWLGEVTTILDVIGNPADWERAGKGLLGVLMLGFAVVYLVTHSGAAQTVKTGATGTVKKAVKVGATVAALAPK